MTRTSQALLHDFAAELVKILCAKEGEEHTWLAEGGHLANVCLALEGRLPPMALAQCGPIVPLHYHLWRLVIDIRDAEIDGDADCQPSLSWIIPTLEALGLPCDSSKSYCNLRALQSSSEGPALLKTLHMERV